MAQSESTTLPHSGPSSSPPGPNMVVPPLTLSTLLLIEMTALHPPLSPSIHRKQRRHLQPRCTYAHRTNLHLHAPNLTYWRALLDWDNYVPDLLVRMEGYGLATKTYRDVGAA